MTPAKSAGPNRCDFRLAGEICWSEDDRLRAYRASVVSVRARHTGGRHARTNSWLLPLRTNLLCRRRKIWRSEEHTSELQSLMRTSYSVFCLKTKNTSK